jgi:hypothetical protein
MPNGSAFGILNIARFRYLELFRLSGAKMTGLGVKIFSTTGSLKVLGVGGLLAGA